MVLRTASLITYSHTILYLQYYGSIQTDYFGFSYLAGSVVRPLVPEVLVSMYMYNIQRTSAQG